VSSVSAAYDRLLDTLRLRDPATRGSGIGTSLAALALAYAFPDDPKRASLVAASALGSDTDTIATMAAAIIGAAGRVTYLPDILDRTYITDEAVRLSAIACGHSPASFEYPDLLHWAPPRSQVDSVGFTETNRPALAGLSWLHANDNERSYPHGETVWRWSASDLGQTFLTKQRTVLRDLPVGNWPRYPSSDVNGTLDRSADSLQLSPKRPSRLNRAKTQGNDVNEPNRTGRPRTQNTQAAAPNIDTMINWISSRGIRDSDVGYAFKRLAETGSAEQTMMLAATLRERLRSIRHTDVLMMSGAEFEDFIQRFFAAQDANDWTRTRTTSAGVDAVIHWPGQLFGESAAVQAKRSVEPVERAAVNDFASRINASDVDRGIMITTSFYTQACYDTAKLDGRIELIDGQRLVYLTKKFLGQDIVISKGSDKNGRS
jgi:hypothetical protein